MCLSGNDASNLAHEDYVTIINKKMELTHLKGDEREKTLGKVERKESSVADTAGKEMKSEERVTTGEKDGTSNRKKGSEREQHDMIGNKNADEGQENLGGQEKDGEELYYLGMCQIEECYGRMLRSLQRLVGI